MRIFRRGLFIALAMLWVTGTGQGVRASAPIYTPVAYMIGHAEEVVEGEVTAISAIDIPKNHPTIWMPNSRLTIKVLEAWRGTRTEPFEVQIEISDSKNKNLKAGNKCIVFIGGLYGKKKSVAAEKQLSCFPAAQGFITINDTDEKLSAKVVGSIKRSVQAYKAPAGDFKDEGVWKPRLNDESLKPFVELLECKDDLPSQAWATRVLYDCYPTEVIAPHMIKLLGEKETASTNLATNFLMRREYAAATDALRTYWGALPAGKEQISLATYLSKTRIQSAIDTFPKDKRAAIHEKLNPEKKYHPNVDLSFGFGFDPDGTIKSLTNQKLGGINEEIQTEFLDWLKAHLETAALEQKEFKFRLQVKIIEYQIVIKCLSP